MNLYALNLEDEITYEQMNGIIYNLNASIDIFYESEQNEEKQSSGIFTTIIKAIQNLIEKIKTLFTGGSRRKKEEEHKNLVNSNPDAEVPVQSARVEELRKAREQAISDVEAGKEPESVIEKYKGTLKALGIGAAIVAGTAVVATGVSKKVAKNKASKEYENYLKLGEEEVATSKYLQNLEKVLNEKNSRYLKFNTQKDAKTLYKAATGKHFLNKEDKEYINQVKAIMEISNINAQSCNWCRSKIETDIVSVIQRNGSVNDLKALGGVMSQNAADIQNANRSDSLKLRRANVTKSGKSYRDEEFKKTAKMKNEQHEAELDMKANSKAIREKSKLFGNDIVKSSEETGSNKKDGKIRKFFGDKKEVKKRANDKLANESVFDFDDYLVEDSETQELVILGALTLAVFAPLVVGGVIGLKKKRELKNVFKLYEKIYPNCIPFNELTKQTYGQDEVNMIGCMIKPIKSDDKKNNKYIVYKYKNKPVMYIALTYRNNGTIRYNAGTSNDFYGDYISTSRNSSTSREVIDYKPEFTFVIVDSSFKKYYNYYMAEMALSTGIAHESINRFLAEMKPIYKKNKALLKESVEYTRALKISSYIDELKK